MLIVLGVLLSLMLAGQANKPCNKECFAKKMSKESNIKERNNEWRYKHERSR